MPEYRTSDPLEQMFTNMVGASGEIDQFGLKQILDALMSQCRVQLSLYLKKNMNINLNYFFNHSFPSKGQQWCSTNN